jgi:hypothetical protein
MKNKLILGLATIALGMFVFIAPAVASVIAEDETCYVAGDCDKCGKSDCKGCDTKAEGKAETKGEGKAKSCATPEGGKACCSHGEKGKKEGKAEEKAEEKKK